MAREHIAQCRVFFDGRSVGGETIRERAILIDLGSHFLHSHSLCDLWLKS